MAKCPRCGRPIGNAETCPNCGYSGHSKSVVDKGMRGVAMVTGTVLETGVKVTEKVVKGATPVVRTVAHEARKGLRKAKEETLKAAKNLKDQAE